LEKVYPGWDQGGEYSAELKSKHNKDSDGPLPWGAHGADAKL
jgi:hypothetical protein